jgi:hypothetical protein
MARYIWVKAHTRRRPRKRTAAEKARAKLARKRESGRRQLAHAETA